MHPRVSLLLIALYSTKIFCSFCLINRSLPYNRPIVSKPMNFKIKSNVNFPPKNYSENTTFVRIDHPFRPIEPLIVRDVMMLVM